MAEQMRRARLNERLRLETHHWRRTAWERAEAKVKAVAAEPAVKPIDLYHSRPRAFVQYAEPAIRNGVLVTVYNPPTEILLKRLNECDRPNHPVERTLRVRAPFLPEYEWFQIGDGTKERWAIWTTTVEQAREDLKRELAEGHGHILPSPFMLFKKNDLKSKT